MKATTIIRGVTVLLFITCFAKKANSQNDSSAVAKPYQIHITSSSIVKDSTGRIYSTEEWQQLVASGDYKLKPVKLGDNNAGFVLERLTEEQKQKARAISPRPSLAFKTGEKLRNFSTTDINGNKYSLKKLKGKIVVLNFWFINCVPCRREIPELNKIVQEYKDSTDIVFLGIAPDKRSDLRDFLEETRFDYNIIDEARFIAQQYNVSAYPTHVILDREGRVFFHTQGLGSSTIYWLQKTIKELYSQKNLTNPAAP